MKKKMAAGLGIFTVGAIALASSLTVAQKNEYQLVRQFGKVKRIIEEPGIYFKVPFVESVPEQRSRFVGAGLDGGSPDPELLPQQCGEQAEYQCIQCHKERDQQYGSGSGHQRENRKPFREGHGKHWHQHGTVRNRAPFL